MTEPKKSQNFRRVLSWGVASFFGVGFLPLAPGTWGSLAAIPLLYFLMPLSIGLQLSGFVIYLAIATLCSAQIVIFTQKKDHQSIVVDEVLGMWLAFLGVRIFFPLPFDLAHWPFVLSGFVLFRIFDVAKIFPVRAIDRWSKSTASPYAAGFGVIADDLAAALQTAFLLLVGLRIFT